MDAHESSTKDHIDEALYSRQLYVLGHDAQRRMAASNVCIWGLTGLGVEISKNLTLAGIKTLTIVDDEIVQWADLSSNFYAHESDVGKVSRAQAASQHLVTLNPYVAVHVLKEAELTDEVLATYQVVVCVDQMLETQKRANKVCRAAGGKFVSTSSRGVFGQIFNDFGDEFIVLDPTGEEPPSTLISAITKDSSPTVSCLDDHRHDFETGDFVSFTEVRGMTEINDGKPRKIKVTGPYTFSLEDSEDVMDFSDYERGGYATKVKMPVTLSFKPLEQALSEPEFLMTDYDPPTAMHVAFQTLDKYRVEREGKFPTPGSAKDAAEFVALMKALDAENADAALGEMFSRCCAGSMNPMAATLGGIVAQEVLKAISFKFMPIKQFLYFKCIQALPEPLPSEDDCAPRGNRYDAQIAIFGHSFQHKLKNLRYFLVGAGAIGCEMLKNWALMGVGTSDTGKVYVTDMDQIEKSNLSRQFLFRDSDIGSAKSTAAANAVKAMNPRMNIESFLERVGPETEEKFNDDFWDNLSGVCNALDNVQARLYVDQRCVYFKKSLLESGTLGTKGNVQVVVPFLTESYGSSRDPPEKSVPICTLKNFPYQIEHTLQWARDYFEGAFRAGPEEIKNYATRGDEFIEELRKQGPGTMVGVLETLKKDLITSKPESLQDCVAWARLVFEELFSSSIQQLLIAFPHDMLDSNGIPFWSGTKRAPNPIKFDISNPMHFDFIEAGALLRAQVYGISTENVSTEDLKAMTLKVDVPEFKPKTGMKFATSDAEAETQGGASAVDHEDTIVEELIKSLPDPDSLKESMNVSPIEFEKDDDSNHHMDFITACSNLRATNYSIEPADRHKSKLIAGKIIPAIATTTAFITGLVCIELLKLVKLGYTDVKKESVQNAWAIEGSGSVSDEKKKEDARRLEIFQNSFCNLTLPFFSFAEPMPAPKTEIPGGRAWTLWDCVEVDEGRDITLKEFLSIFEERYGWEISMLSCGVSILYSSFTQAKKLQERMPMTMSEIARTVSKLEFGKSQKYLVFEVCCNDKDGEDVEIPYIRYKFR
uniref:E1 ubiquitin-activating enzyme n=1 Tax=Timspurckia oligopyrenoides TaxID=708627 RepID=A0A7S1ETX1_9RHOD|mmetsp:Transcript_7064/g.12670  ORF Transcript_7064/g.12670 Transcript_7064/m.12670 type:complete len:1048 (+) Transcript_7064:325-3468(+)